eukprot:5505537-Pyramimonas_sp.AAC.1
MSMVESRCRKSQRSEGPRDIETALQKEWLNIKGGQVNALGIQETRGVERKGFVDGAMPVRASGDEGRHGRGILMPTTI